jgi:hypothetical protein
MRDGVCPKCGLDEVYKKKAEGHYRIPGMFGQNPILTVCTKCGYYEHYIEDNRYIQDIKEDWSPVNWKRKRKNDGSNTICQCEKVSVHNVIPLKSIILQKISVTTEFHWIGAVLSHIRLYVLIVVI